MLSITTAEPALSWVVDIEKEETINTAPDKDSVIFADEELRALCECLSGTIVRSEVQRILSEANMDAEKAAAKEMVMLRQRVSHDILRVLANRQKESGVKSSSPRAMLEKNLVAGIVTRWRILWSINFPKKLGYPAQDPGGAE